MKVTFINHASILIENAEGEKLITDPWNHGQVFNNSWELLDNSESLQSQSQEVLESVDYIWISHEHPDHFHFPTLRSIPEEKRKQITVLFREEKKTNVKDALLKFGFKVKLLSEKIETNVGGFSFYTLDKGHDTAAIITDGTHTLFNQNDCKLKTTQIEQIKEKYPNIDYYLYQFGLAGFYGNSDDASLFKNVRDLKLASIKDVIDIIQPKKYIPFASYISFCQSANAYLNREQVKLSTLNDYLNQANYNFHIPKPLQEISVEAVDKEENSKNASYWDEMFQSKKSYSGRAISEENITSAIGKYNENVVQQERKVSLKVKLSNWINSYLKSKSDWNILIVSSTQAFLLTTSRKGFSKKLTYSLRSIEIDKELCEKELTTYKNIATNNKAKYIIDAEQLVYAFEQLWGSDTFNISGGFYILNGSKSHLISLFKQYYRI